MNLLRTGLMFTGGLDSTIAATMLVRSGIKPFLIQIDEGLPAHVKSGKRVARELGLGDRHIIIDAASVFANLNVPEHERGEHIGFDYQCGHFMILTSIALAHAEKHSIQILGSGNQYSVFGWTEDDPAISSLKTNLGKVKDTTPDFRQAVINLYNEYYKTTISMSDPMFHLTKVNAVMLGQQLKAPLKWTCSCRNPDLPKKKMPVHCGELSCRPCNERKAVFRVSGVPDPSTYLATKKLPKGYLKKAKECWVASTIDF